MAEILYCSCGQAIELARTDVLETLDCPACKRPLTLDVFPEGKRQRGYLTVVAGPDRLNERILMPADCPLGVGSGEDNWLCLLHGSVSAHHCTLQLESSGMLQVGAGRNSHPPTGKASSFRAQLKPTQTLKIGDFHLRFSLADHSDTVTAAPPPPPMAFPEPVRTPTMRRVLQRNRFLGTLEANRFKYARVASIVAGGLIALFQFVTVMRVRGWPFYWGAVMLAVTLALMSEAVRRIDAWRLMRNLFPIGFFVLLAIAEAVAREPGGMIAALLMAAGLTLTIARSPHAVALSFGFALKLVAIGLMAALILRPNGPLFFNA